MTESHENIRSQERPSADAAEKKIQHGTEDGGEAASVVTAASHESDAETLRLLQIIRTESKDLQRSDAFAELLCRYRPLIEHTVNRYAMQTYGSDLSMIDRQELEEEACIALYHAARFYRTGTHATFGYFARVCIRNRLVSFLRKQKNEEYLLRIDENDFDEESSKRTVQPADLTVGDIGEQVAAKDAFRALFDRFLLSLTDYEKRVFHMYVKGCSYKEIAMALSVPIKSVDNAVYRIRVKLKQQLQAQ